MSFLKINYNNANEISVDSISSVGTYPHFSVKWLATALSPFFLCRKRAATRRLLPLDPRVQCHAIQQKDFVAGIRWNLFKFLTELYNWQPGYVSFYRFYLKKHRPYLANFFRKDYNRNKLHQSKKTARPCFEKWSKRVESKYNRWIKPK